jgi:hypothetical protein
MEPDVKRTLEVFSLRQVPSKGPKIDGRIILKLNVREVGWDTGWIDQAQDRDRRRVLVNVLMKTPRSIKLGEFLH